MNARLLLLILVVILATLAFLALRNDSARGHLVELDGPPTEASSAVTASEDTLAAPPPADTSTERNELPAAASSAKDARSPSASRIVANATCVIFGRVADPRNKNAHVQDGRITVLTGTRESGRARIQPNGSYEVSAEVSGRVTVRCEVRGYLDAEFPLDIARGTTRVQHDFELEGTRSVHVSLRDPSGRPLFSTLSGPDLPLSYTLRPLLVEACPPRGRMLPAVAHSVVQHAHPAFSTGKFTGETWYDIDTTSPPPLWVCVLLGEFVIDTAELTPGVDDVTLVVSVENLHAGTGSLEVVIVDDGSGTPLAGASVAVTSAPGTKTSVFTDVRGHASVTGVASGTARLEVRANDHVPKEMPVEIAAGGSLDVGFVRVEPGVFIAGIVQHAPGQVFRGQVRCIVTDTETVAFDDTPIATADGQKGEFKLTGLARRKYMVGVGPPAGGLDPEEVRSGSVPGWRYVDASGGSISGIVLDVPDEKALIESRSKRAEDAQRKNGSGRVVH